jgi:predicted ABC-type ATPase
MEKNTNSRGEYTPERKALHEKIVNEVLSKGEKAIPPDKPVLVVLTGPPGSGKTTAGQPIIKKNFKDRKFATLNADDAKVKLPEYQGWNAAAVHEESSYIVEDLIYHKAFKENYNVVADITGQNGKKVKQWIKEASKAGYDVHIVNVTVPIHTSVERAYKRFLGKEGRYVPLDYVKEGVDYKPQKNFKELKNLPEVSTWTNIDNSGSVAKTIGRGGPGRKQRVKKAEFESTPYIDKTRDKDTTLFNGLTINELYDRMDDEWLDKFIAITIKVREEKEEVQKFNPNHDELGRFAPTNNPKGYDRISDSPSIPTRGTAVDLLQAGFDQDENAVEAHKFVNKVHNQVCDEYPAVAAIVDVAPIRSLAIFDNDYVPAEIIGSSHALGAYNDLLGQLLLSTNGGLVDNLDTSIERYAVGTGMAVTYRHEFGHHIWYNYGKGNAIAQVRFENEFDKLAKHIQKRTVEKSISRYAASLDYSDYFNWGRRNTKETFAETFSIWTNPKYHATTEDRLPPTIEAFMMKHFPRKVKE